MAGGSADAEEDALFAELYGDSGGGGATGGRGGLGSGGCRLGLLLLSGLLAVAPWRNCSAASLGALLDVYGRPLCADAHPCAAVTPFDVAASASDAAAGLATAAASMDANGVVIMRGAVPAATCSAARSDLAAKLEEFLAPASGGGSGGGSKLAWAPGIKQPTGRDHVQLDLGSARSMLSAALGPSTVLRATLAAALGEDAMMVELAVIRSHAGASAQQLHADTTPRLDGRDAKLLTVFMPLQTVTAEMGPLQVCAGSHTCLPAYGSFEADTSSWCDKHCATVTTQLGDVVVIDSRLHHRANRHTLDRLAAPATVAAGTASTRSTSRYVLYASFVEESVVRPDLYPKKPYLRALFPIGSTLAMHEQLWGALTLRSLADHTTDADDVNVNNHHHHHRLQRAVPLDEAKAAIRAARQQQQQQQQQHDGGGAAVGRGVEEQRRHLFWNAAVLHSAATQQQLLERADNRDDSSATILSRPTADSGGSGASPSPSSSSSQPLEPAEAEGGEGVKGLQQLQCWDVARGRVHQPHQSLLLLLSVECVVAALECAAQRLVVDVPERGVGLVLGLATVLSSLSTLGLFGGSGSSSPLAYRFISQSVIATAMIVPVLGWQLLAHGEPLPLSELLGIGLQLVAFECGCASVLAAVWLFAAAAAASAHQ